MSSATDVKVNGTETEPQTSSPDPPPPVYEELFQTEQSSTARQTLATTDATDCINDTGNWPNDNAQVAGYESMKWFPMLNFAVLDYSYYIGEKGRHYPKEFGVVLYPSMNRQQWVFGPPKALLEVCSPAINKVNMNLERTNIHRICDGYVPYSKLPEVLHDATAGIECIYVNGGTRAKLVASIINRPVRNMKKLYEWVRFGDKLDGDYDSDYRYEYASPCLKHSKLNRLHCPKAHCTFLYSIIKNHISAICKGKAEIKIIEPSSNFEITA